MYDGGQFCVALLTCLLSYNGVHSIEMLYASISVTLLYELNLEYIPILHLVVECFQYHDCLLVIHDVDLRDWLHILVVAFT